MALTKPTRNILRNRDNRNRLRLGNTPLPLGLQTISSSTRAWSEWIKGNGGMVGNLYRNSLILESNETTSFLPTQGRSCGWYQGQLLWCISIYRMGFQTEWWGTPLWERFERCSWCTSHLLKIGHDKQLGWYGGPDPAVGMIGPMVIPWLSHDFQCFTVTSQSPKSFPMEVSAGHLGHGRFGFGSCDPVLAPQKFTGSCATAGHLK